MSTLNGVVRILIVAALATTAVAATARPASACTCLPSTVESSYNTSSDVFRARILLELHLGSSVRYLAQVRRTFKGCLQPEGYVVLVTPSSSAACGVQMDIGDDLLLNGQGAGSFFGLDQLAVHLCDYNRPFDQLSESDLEFLNGRMVCCGEDCTCADGSDPVQCLVDPCEVAPDCPEGECAPNFCGGCHAEHFDEKGFAVCQGECRTDADCMVTGCSGQVCAPEPVITTCEWRPEYACYQDPGITTCGCQSGTCAWAKTPELDACLESAGSGGAVLQSR